MRAYFITFLFLFSHIFCVAQNPYPSLPDSLSYGVFEPIADTIPVLNIFDTEEPISLTLKYDISAFIRHKMKGQYLDAEMNIEYEGFTHKKNIRLKARGNYRREQCFFPPIYLNFKSSPTNQVDFNGIKKLKLVTHCSSSKSSRSYILKEYLAYKLYNVISNNSFRVKLVDIHYIDTGKKQRNYEQIGFLIEPLDLLTKRTNSTEIEPTAVRSNNVVPESADIVALFQFMIGNTDWRIKGGHNTKFTKSFDQISPLVIPIPYDFDFSGIVSTHYSFPQEWTSIEKVTDREYLGYCRPNSEYYLSAVNLFKSKKEQIFNLINTFDYLPVKETEVVRKYIESFYDRIENEKRIIQTLQNECRDSNF